MNTTLESRTFACRLLTSMFSCGAYSQQPEIRPPEFKGLMRYTYRITCATPDSNALLRDESALFGGAASANNSGHASPIRLSITNAPAPAKEKQQLLLHDQYDDSSREKEKDTRKFKPQLCLNAVDFKLKLTLNKVIDIDPGFAVDLDWYSDLLVLSLLLGGLGKRSRKGRGRVMIQDYAAAIKSEKDLMPWIADTLNKTAKMSKPAPQKQLFQLSSDKKVICNNGKWPDRPVIQRIQLDDKTALKDAEAINKYLKKVDNACHELKKNPKEQRATGSPSPRLASPLIISIVALGKNYYPLYTFVNAPWNFDKNLVYRQNFIKRLSEVKKS